MKHLLTLSFMALFAIPAFANPNPPTDEERAEWKATKEEYRADKADWKANGKPDPKPERPTKPF